MKSEVYIICSVDSIEANQFPLSIVIYRILYEMGPTY